MGTAPEQMAPAGTFALLVGVERHDAGAHWDLDGPAADAACFAAWLSKRGVPGAQMVACVSPRPRKVPLQWPQGCKTGPATRDHIENELRRILGEERHRFLILYWGGHGALRRGEDRRLFYADARPDDLRNVDLTELLTMLRSDRHAAAGKAAPAVPPFEKQLIIVDACANFIEEARLPIALPTQKFGEAPPRYPAPEQFALFAARPGEYATNLSAAKTGLFSRELRAELEKRPVEEWPPDMESVTRALVERFERLRAQGLAHQAPAFVWNRDWVGNRRNFGQFTEHAPPAVGPAATQLTRPQLGALLTALLECPPLQSYERREALRLELRPAISHSVRHESDARGHVLQILETCLRYPGGLAELLEVLKLVAGPTPEVESVEMLIRQIAPGALPPAA
jgi:hypothetical protein